MIERLLLLGLAALVIVAVWVGIGLWRRARLRHLQRLRPLAAVVPPGRPAIVAFSSPTCAECHSRQAPALARLADLVGDAVTVRTVSALDHPDLVRQVGILTVPATVVVDAAGIVRHLNLGYRGERTLREQVLPLAD